MDFRVFPKNVTVTTRIIGTWGTLYPTQLELARATMPSVREETEVFLHEHRFLVTKLLESLHTASL